MDELLMQELSGSNGAAMFDSDSLSKVQELAKALSVGYDMTPADQTGFGATRIESLERTLKQMTAKVEDAKLFQLLRKGKAESTVEEFATLNEIGDAGFYTEGGLPEEYDEELKREYEQVKYVGTVGKVPNVAQVTKHIAKAVDTVTKAKAAALIRRANVSLYFGDSGNASVEWNGFLKQFNARVKNASQNVIDMEGKRLRPEDINNGLQIIADNYGNPNNTKLFMANQAFQDYTDELLQGRRFVVGSSEARSVIATAKKYELGLGAGNIETDIFLRHKGEAYLDRTHPKLNAAGTAFAAATSKPPTTLDSGSCVVEAAADTTSNLTAADYTYAVVPRNKYGAGAAFEVSVTIGSNEKASFTTLEDNSSPAGQEATAFDIYRKLASATAKTSYQFVKTIKASDTVKDDANDDRPGTTYSFLWDWDFDQVLDFRLLLPMVKMPLAVIDDSIRWLQKMYGVPLLFNPNKMVVFKNVGSTAHS